MRIQIASDLHLECLPARFGAGPTLAPAPGADVLVLAGDIHSGHEALRIFANWPVPVVYVAGNHESYEKRRTVQNEVTRILAAEVGVHFLENSAVELQGVRFLGCTLWTDYELYGNSPAAKATAAMSLYDHSLIEGENGPFSPHEARHCHLHSRHWLREQLLKPFVGKTVVVTHHGPHPGCASPRFRGSPLNPAFMSDLRELMGAVDLWVHGHTHDSVDVRERHCRIVANPRGYARNARAANTFDELQFENASFDPQLVIKV